MIIKVGRAPCDTCGRELITDQKLGTWYFAASCADIHGDGCTGHADDTRAYDDTEAVW